MNMVDDAKLAVHTVAQVAMSKLVLLAPDIWMPGGPPDPLIHRKHGLIGPSAARPSLRPSGR